MKSLRNSKPAVRAWLEALSSLLWPLIPYASFPVWSTSIFSLRKLASAEASFSEPNIVQRRSAIVLRCAVYAPRPDHLAIQLHRSIYYCSWSHIERLCGREIYIFSRSETWNCSTDIVYIIFTGLCFECFSIDWSCGRVWYKRPGSDGTVKNLVIACLTSSMIIGCHMSLNTHPSF